MKAWAVPALEPALSASAVSAVEASCTAGTDFHASNCCEETGFEYAPNRLWSGLLCAKAVGGQRVRTRCRVFDSMELGVEHCEDRFLEVALQYGLWRPRQQVMSLEDTLRTHDSMPNMVLGKPIDYQQVAGSLKPFMKVCPQRCSVASIAFTGIEASLPDKRSLLDTRKPVPLFQTAIAHCAWC